MKTFIKPIIAIALLLSVASCKHDSKESENILSADAIPVKVVNIKSGQNSSDISATGLVTTENEADYAFKIGGIIENIYVEEGQFFKKGKLLASLNNTEIGAGLDQAKLNVEKAKRDYVRTVNLYKDSVYSLEQMQDAKTRLDIAQKSKDAVAFNAQYSKIYATNDGFVNKKIANIGEVINAGATVFSINESRGNGEYVLKVGVTDKEWVLVELGQKAKVTLDGFPSDTINAIVFRKSQVAATENGSFQIELKLSLGKNKPAIGMFGKAQILTDRQSTYKVIPYDALLEADGDQAFVFTLNDQGKVRKLPITIAGFNNKDVYVKSGLEDTTRIIVSNSAFLNEQSRIKIIK